MGQIGELVENQIDALQSGLFKLGDLLLDDRFERNVRREETATDTMGVLDGERDLSAQLLLVELLLQNKMMAKVTMSSDIKSWLSSRLVGRSVSLL